MPFCEGGELLDRVSMNKRIGELEARPLFRQVLDGVAFLQRNGVCHRCEGHIHIVDTKWTLLPKTEYELSVSTVGPHKRSELVKFVLFTVELGSWSRA